MTEENYHSLFEQLRNFLFETAKIVAAISIIAVPLGYITIPLIDSYIDHKIEDFVAAMDDGNKPDIIEFRGNGIVMAQGPFKPGDIVPILYLLKSKGNCTRDVEVRYIGPNGNVLTHLTRSMRATQATQSLDYIPFTVNLEIPNIAPEGPLVYGAIIRPINCPEFNDQVVVPFSTVIMVKR